MKNIILVIIALLTVGIFLSQHKVPRNGLYKEYYDNGQLKSEAYFIDGKEHGISKSYYENGTLWSVFETKMGILQGAKEYYENGNLKLELDFDEGKLSSQKEYDEQGNLITDLRKKDLYDEQGKLVKLDSWREPTISKETNVSCKEDKDCRNLNCKPKTSEFQDISFWSECNEDKCVCYEVNWEDKKNPETPSPRRQKRL